MLVVEEDGRLQAVELVVRLLRAIVGLLAHLDTFLSALPCRFELELRRETAVGEDGLETW